MRANRKALAVIVSASVALVIAGLLIISARNAGPVAPLNPAQPEHADKSTVVASRSNVAQDQAKPPEAAPPVAASVEPQDAALAVMFHADANRRLVLNPETRLNIEKLHALNSPEEFLAKLERFAIVLPAEAYGDLMATTKNYIQYITALEREFPPEAEVTTVGAARAELKGLHELRVKHFGAETAEAFFGDEERMSHRMVELMALDADEKLTLAEKAHRAQQFLQPEPDVVEAPRDAQK